MKPLTILYEIIKAVKGLIKAHPPAFLRGAVVAVIPSGIFLFGTPMLQVHFVVAYLIKAVGVALMTFISGLGSAASGEVTKHAKKRFANWKRRRATKRKQNKTNNHEDNNHMPPAGDAGGVHYTAEGK